MYKLQNSKDSIQIKLAKKFACAIAALPLTGFSPGSRHKVAVTSVCEGTSTGVLLENLQNCASVVFETLHGGKITNKLCIMFIPQRNVFMLVIGLRIGSQNNFQNYYKFLKIVRQR